MTTAAASSSSSSSSSAPAAAAETAAAAAPATNNSSKVTGGREQLEPRTHEGILQLREGVLVFKKWKPHFVKVDANFLYVSKTQNDPVHKHKVALTQGYVANLDDNSDDRENAFEVKLATGEVLEFKGNSLDEVKQWIMTIKVNARLLDLKLMNELTQPNPFEGFKGKVLKMGWVHERFAGVNSWHWKYMVMTDCSLMMFDKAPANNQALSQPTTHFFLFECKPRQTPPSQDETETRKHTFMLASHLPAVLIATETRMELSNWLNAIKATTMNALHAAQEFKYNVTFEGQPAVLVIRRNEGFSLLTTKDNVQLWHYQTSQFKSVRVNGNKSTLFDFGKFSDRVLEVTSPDSAKISIVVSSVMDYLAFTASMNVSKQSPEASKRASGQNTPTGSQEAAERGF